MKEMTKLCGYYLFLITVALVVYFPASAQQQARVSSRSSEGLQTTRFQTPQGEVTVFLPDDIHTGDVISGTVLAKPAGKTEEEIANNRNILNGLVVEMEDTETPVEQQKEQWNIPAELIEGVTELILKDHTGNPLGRAELPVNTTPRGPIQGEITAGDFTIPSYGRAGRPVAVTGPFDGDFSSSGITINQENITLLAESPGKVIFESPTDITGPAEIVLTERGIVVKDRINLLDVNLSAAKLDLVEGEKTEVMIQVTGMKELEEDVLLGIVNLSRETITMSGGNEQVLEITPEETGANGTFEFVMHITAIQKGRYSIWTYVIPPVSGEEPHEAEQGEVTGGAYYEDTGATETGTHPDEDFIQAIDTAVALPVPAPITDIAVSGKYGERIFVDWEPSDAKNISGYHVYVSDQEITGTEGLTPAAVITDLAKTFIVLSGLDINKEYSVAVTPVDKEGIENTEIVTAIAVIPQDSPVYISDIAVSGDKSVVTTTILNNYPSDKSASVVVTGDRRPLVIKEITLTSGENVISIDLPVRDIGGIQNIDVAVTEPGSGIVMSSTDEDMVAVNISSDGTISTIVETQKETKEERSFWDKLADIAKTGLGIAGITVAILLLLGLFIIFPAWLAQLLKVLSVILNALKWLWDHASKIPGYIDMFIRWLTGAPPRAPVGDPIPLSPRARQAGNKDSPNPGEAEKATDIAEEETDIAESETNIAETNAEKESETAETNSENAEEEAEKDSAKETQAEQAERVAEHPPAEAQSELSEANSEASECNSEAAESWSEAAEDPSEYGEAQSEVNERESEAAEAYSEHGIPPENRPPFNTGA